MLCEVQVVLYAGWRLYKRIQSGCVLLFCCLQEPLAALGALLDRTLVPQVRVGEVDR